MSATPALADHLVIAASVALSFVHTVLAYPATVRRMHAGDPGAKRRLYGYILLVAWAMAACVAALWLANGRPWAALWLRPAAWYRTAAGCVVAAAYVALALRQRVTLPRRPEVLARVGRTYAHLRPMLPETDAEQRWFNAVSVTAGFCEELFYRGFVTWYAASFVGLPAAVVVSAAVFGLDHLYLGRSYVLRSGIGGLVFGLVALLSGSLWPAMVMHAAADLVSGDLGRRALAAADADDDGATAETKPRAADEQAGAGGPTVASAVA
jgi:membrane protease YdiL (CAAX protease family)